MKEDKKKAFIKYIKALMFPVFILVFMSIVTYSVINQVLIESNIENMVEMSQHDKRTLSNILNSQWESLSNIPEIIKKLNITEDDKIIECLQINDRMYDGNSTTMIITSEGVCYQSDGVVETYIDGYNLISEYDDNFAIINNMTEHSVIEKRKEYIIIGIKLENLTVGDKHFEYALRRININALDYDLEIDSYGGEGFCSVINKEGSFITNRNRTDSGTNSGTDNVIERKNFFNMLSDASITEYKNLEELKEKLDDVDEGITFVANIKDYSGIYDKGSVISNNRNPKKKYLIHMEKLENTDWYFVSQVPVSVFSSLSKRVFGVVSILLIIIIVTYLVMIWGNQKRSIRKEIEEESHKKQLSEALVMAKQASVAKTTFLSNMSHDIRTPMNAIVGFTSLAIKRIDDKEQVLDYLNKIAQSSEHLRSLINDILDMSRIESGKIQLNEQEENIKSIIYNNIDIFTAAIESKNVKLSLDIKDIQNEYVVCDKIRLNQALMNLLSNAIKYTGNDGVVNCIVTQEAVDTNGVSIYEFKIQDNGIGISEEFSQSIFEQFTREQSSTVSGIQGTGLGMAITKSIVDMMGGTITCKSKKNVGTEFSVRLPFKVIVNQSEIKQQTDNKRPEETDDMLKGKRILLVDDNELNLEIVKEILNESDIEVGIAFNGKEACDELLSKGAGYYNLVLMDVLMPVMDGHEATRKIRGFKDKKLAAIPVIAMTANAFEEDKQAALQAGMQGHIAKPVDIDILIEEIKKYINI